MLYRGIRPDTQTERLGLTGALDGGGLRHGERLWDDMLGLYSRTPEATSQAGQQQYGGPVGTAEWMGSVDLGCAGAVSARACGLCVAGSYQTGSGSARQCCAERAGCV